MEVRAEVQEFDRLLNTVLPTVVRDAATSEGRTLYRAVMSRVGMPLLRQALELSAGNQLRAAAPARDQSQYAPQAAASPGPSAAGARERARSQDGLRAVALRRPRSRLGSRGLHARPILLVVLVAACAPRWAASLYPVSPLTMSRAASGIPIPRCRGPRGAIGSSSCGAAHGPPRARAMFRAWPMTAPPCAPTAPAPPSRGSATPPCSSSSRGPISSPILTGASARARCHGRDRSGCSRRAWPSRICRPSTWS